MLSHGRHESLRAMWLWGEENNNAGKHISWRTSFLGCGEAWRWNNISSGSFIGIDRSLLWSCYGTYAHPWVEGVARVMPLRSQRGSHSSWEGRCGTEYVLRIGRGKIRSKVDNVPRCGRGRAT